MPYEKEHFIYDFINYEIKKYFDGFETSLKLPYANIYNAS